MFICENIDQNVYRSYINVCVRFIWSMEWYIGITGFATQNNGSIISKIEPSLFFIIQWK